jgi:GGDEF domain-containing protein
MTTTASVEWALVLLGTVPPEADVTLEALGRVLGLQMERLALERATEARTRFEEILVRAERPVELTALDVLRELVSQTSGAGAALWVQHDHELRRMAAVGVGVGSVEAPLPEEQQSTSTHQVRTVLLGTNRRARLELRSGSLDGSGRPFDSDAQLLTDACASVLRGWLPAAVRPARRDSPLLSPAVVADFARRIEEELARAKRFDRNLALVVVESGVLAWSQDTTDRLVDLLRGELRGSDVLGLVGDRRVAVLLIETHESAVSTVVGRLRERLGRAIPELKLPTLVLGQAAFSTNCATADALLSQAVVNAETITVPA